MAGATRRAIVTGAASGIGQAVALRLLHQGVTVVAVDRNEHVLGDLPDNVRREVADTTDPPVAPQLIDRTGEVGPPACW